MAEVPFSDPLAWRPVKAPSLEEFEVLAIEAFRRLPEKFRALCEGLVVRVDDFPTDDVLEELRRADANSTCSGCSRASACRSAPRARRSQMPNMIWLYRRPILDYWAEHDETLGAIVTHVLVHEIGHHFGLSDDDMMALERSADLGWTPANSRQSQERRKDDTMKNQRRMPLRCHHHRRRSRSGEGLGLPLHRLSVAHRFGLRRLDSDPRQTPSR